MEENNVLSCPVCKDILLKEEKTFKCKKNHAYDLAKEGYVNLLLAKQKHSKEPGDSKEMIMARKKFLNDGYYQPLSEAINNIVKKLVFEKKSEKVTILDAGCGEGYYLDNLNKSLSETKKIAFYGIDISKEGIRLSAKRNKNISFAVGSIFEMPIQSQSIDCLLSVFAPLAETEFTRVLKKEGKVVVVSPGAYHLYGLKKLLYENPYLNDEEKVVLKNFHLIERIKIKYDFTVTTSEQLSNLILMTPYYWNTDMNRIAEIIKNVKNLSTYAEFILSIYSL